MGERTASAAELHRRAVAAYVAAGGEESVQRVITAVQGLSRRLDQWYAHQLADLETTPGSGPWSPRSPRTAARSRPRSSPSSPTSRRRR
ncbi:hypothetical protein [Agromyces marinus]|uniref:hypothetical protein n=1 Tax=Agromyces marinus TaxID=1389020 RepID=UPI00257379F2|nr:hypothetical protein [Agromyces marinus]